MKNLIVSFVFLGSLGLGWASVPQKAECRQCNVKRCFHDSACGRLCTCVFNGGKKYKAGVCMQTSSSDRDDDRDEHDHDHDRDESSSNEED